MITLHDLICCDLISKEHHVYFHFKQNYFESTISEMGCIYNTFLNGTMVFHDRSPFDSISEWADACIQELCKEYVTRFSAWKRISHKESGLSLHTLRQLYNQFANGKVPITNQTMTTLRQCLTSSLNYIKVLELELKLTKNYINGHTSQLDNHVIQKPVALEKIIFLHNKYLQDNNSKN